MRPKRLQQRVFQQYPPKPDRRSFFQPVASVIWKLDRQSSSVLSVFQIRSDTVWRREKAVHMVLRRVKADMKITISGWNLIAVRDHEQLGSRHQMMVARMEQDRISMLPFLDVGIGDALAVAAHGIAFAARGRVGPAAAGLMRRGMDGQTEQDCSRDQNRV